MFSSSNSEAEDNKFKQRLVGALVLIALAVIIIPMFLDFRKDYGRVIRGSNIPPKPDDFHTEVIAITPPEEARPLPAVKESAEVPTDEAATDEVPTDEASTEEPPSEPPVLTARPETPAKKPAASPPKTARPETSTPPVKTTPVPEPAKEVAKVVPEAVPKETVPEAAPKKEVVPRKEVAPAVEGGWIVQLGSFSNTQNAEELRDQLLKKNYKAFVDEVTVEGKRIQRVRIGPFEKKSGADATRDKLAIEMKLDAIVLSNQ